MFKDSIISTIEQNEQTLIELAEKIWAFAETNYTEHQSSKLLANFLENEGFTVEREAASIPTAFVATFGNEGPIIGVLGEYDALSGLSQTAGGER